MILVNFFIAFFAVFISPLLLLGVKFKEKPYSLVFIYSVICSFSIVWILLLVSYFLSIPNSVLAGFAWLTVFVTWYIVFKNNRGTQRDTNALWIILLLTFFILLPIFHYTGDLFGGWDAYSSWNRWALELYDNRYHPIDAAYPVLLPALWALFYKFQGTSEVWWTVKLTLFILPFFTLAIILLLYRELKESAFIFFSFLLYPYLLWAWLYNGYADMPVMLIGTLSLIVLYAAERLKENKLYEYYLYASILLAALASIIKQAGLVFLVFVLLYIYLNRQYIKRPKKVFFLAVVSFGFFASYLLFLYIPNAHHGVAGNLDHLTILSEKKIDKAHNLKEYMHYLWVKFFSYPPTPWWLHGAFVKPLQLKPITPYLILVGLLAFAYKDLRKYKNLNVLSAVFFFLGVAVWVYFFSYDARNSYWVKAFLILFFGINIGYIYDTYATRFVKKIIAFMVFTLGVFALFKIGNSYAIELQKKSQLEIGDPKLAAFLKKNLESRDKCFRIYTTDHMIRYNYILNPYREQIEQLFTVNDFVRFLEHNCSDGRLFVFRPQSRAHAVWDYVWKLTNDKKWTHIDFNSSDSLFFIAPNSSFPKNYFATKTALSYFPIKKTKDDVQFSIDRVKYYDEGISIFAWAFLKNAQVDNTRKYIVLQNKQKQYIINTIPWIRPDITKYFHAKDLSKAGFIGHIYTTDFPPGKYRLFLLLVDAEGEQHFRDVNKTITIKGKK